MKLIEVLQACGLPKDLYVGSSLAIATAGATLLKAQSAATVAALAAEAPEEVDGLILDLAKGAADSATYYERGNRMDRLTAEREADIAKEAIRSRFAAQSHEEA